MDRDVPDIMRIDFNNFSHIRRVSAGIFDRIPTKTRRLRISETRPHHIRYRNSIIPNRNLRNTKRVGESILIFRYNFRCYIFGRGRSEFWSSGSPGSPFELHGCWNLWRRSYFHQTNGSPLGQKYFSLHRAARKLRARGQNGCSFQLTHDKLCKN